MEVFLIYILKVNVLLLLVWLIYYLLLSKHTFHQLKRWYLVLGVIISLVVPALSWKQLTVIPITISNTISDENIVENTVQSFDWWSIGYALALVLIVLYSVRASWSLWKAIQALKKITNAAIKVDGYNHLYMSEAVEVPFSTKNNIYIHPNLLHSASLHHILLHEQKHIADKHYIDIWLLQVLNACFSYNPIVKRLLHDVKLNHEFIVDDYMVQSVDPISYQLQLLQFQHKNFQIDLANQFAFSNLKQRIIFMNTSQSSKWKWSSLLLGAMILGATSFAMAYENVTVYEITEQHINKDTTKQPLMLVNGKNYNGDINSIDPKTIASVHVYKNDEALQKYGQEGANGVVNVVLKSKSSLHNIEKVQEQLSNGYIPIKILPIGEQVNNSNDQNTAKVNHTSDTIFFEKISSNHKLGNQNNDIDTIIEGGLPTFTVSLLESNDDLRNMLNQTILDELKKPNGKDNPLFQKVTYIVDGKARKDISDLDPQNIESINVVNILKSQENGQKGVIEIKLKK